METKSIFSAMASMTLMLSMAPITSAYAQSAESDGDGPLEEVIVTGTAIKRVDLNNALPVQVLSLDEINRVGITNAADLVEKIPAMQGFSTASDSVGGSGGGVRSASLRGLGDSYTLSLLNGRRMAPADSGSAIDISNIPVAALQRVEVLTDGASALYGADAIAGVVNFILKDSVEETTISLRGDRPQEDGGESWGVDAVTGFGDLYSDGYSIVATLSHEEQDPLAAADRDFAETGFVTFEQDGQSYFFENSSSNSIPGNATAYTAGFTDVIATFNPNQLNNGGQCAQQTTPKVSETGTKCRFDYTSTIQILPESERDTLTLNGKLKLGEDLTGFATVMASKYEQTSRIAPYPTGEIPLPIDSDLVRNEVFPHLTADQIARTGVVVGEWRALPAGNRTTTYEIESTNITAGLQGERGDISYDIAYTHAQTKNEQSYPTGWLLGQEFVDIVGSGAVNIFASQDDFTDADLQALAPAIYSGDWDVVDTTIDGLDGKAAMPLFDLSGGSAQLAVGFDYRKTSYDRSISEANAAEIILFNSKDTPYELERDQFGVFTELLLPVMDNLEFTAALRYDDISATSDSLNGGDIDEGDSDTTYKISTLWNATDAVAFRASYGTGFKAPSMREIGEPLSDFGVTSGTFACPFAASDARAIWCKAGENQVNVFRQGSGNLTFETSKQYSIGMVLTPTNNLDITIDYWNIELEDIVDRATEQQIFDNPALYDDLFTTKTNVATGREELAIIQAAINVADSEQAGFDWAVNYAGIELGFGTLDLKVNGTYMNKQDNSLYGSSLGQFGGDDNVIFRNIVNTSATLNHGKFTHTLFSNYRSGYRDQEVSVEVLGTGVPLGLGPKTDIQLEVDDYMTVDYQLRYYFNDKTQLGFGIKNLFDEAPHLSLRESGAGHQVGWDPRYSDAYGRTFYANASVAF